LAQAIRHDPSIGKFIQADSIVPAPGNPQSLNRYAYVYNNPLRYTDPSGHTARSALDLVRAYQNDIKDIARRYGLDPVLLAGVVFAENRNDYNWLRGQDWSSVFTLGTFGGPELKNVLSPLLRANPSLGITEVSLAVAAMMDNPDMVPDNYGTMSRQERADLHETIARGLSREQRSHILNALSDPRTSIEYSAKYLRFLGQFRNYGGNMALHLSEYNRGLTDLDTVTEYGMRIDLYRQNIVHALNTRVDPPSICIGTRGCALYYENHDKLMYGRLP
jgi:hypothetical protein